MAASSRTRRKPSAPSATTSDDERCASPSGDFGVSPAHAVIFYQPPVTPAELQRVAQAKPVQIVVLARPGEIAWLRELTGGRLTPLNLTGPERRAHDREEAVRQELRAVWLAAFRRARSSRSSRCSRSSMRPSWPLRRSRSRARARATPRRRCRGESGAGRAKRASDRWRRPAPALRGRNDPSLHDDRNSRRRKDGDLMGAIAGEGGIPGDHVGKIDLRESHASRRGRRGRRGRRHRPSEWHDDPRRRVVVRGERDKEDRDRAAAPRGDRPSGPRGERSSSGPRDRRAGSRDRVTARDRGGPPAPDPAHRRESSDRNRGGPPRRDRDRS